MVHLFAVRDFEEKNPGFFFAFLKAASLTQAGPSDENDNDHTGANDDLKPASCERERRMEEVQPLCL